MSLRVATRLILAAATVSAVPSDPSFKQIVVDVASGSSSGLFKLHQGVDRGPSCDSGVSFANDLHDMRSTFIRTHDANVLDWCVLFPNSSADTEDPASYAWTAGDAYFQEITGNGFQPYFRLGSSWNVPNISCIRPDPTTFSRVAVRTVQHYTAGWANGFFGTVPFWEIGNEPDGTRFWNLTASDFYTLFDTTVRALKTYNASLVVGGPGVSNTLSNYSRPYAFGLIDFIESAGTPVDFYSWHYYGTDAKYPQVNYNNTLTSVRAYLNAAGLTQVKQHVTEWAGSILGSNNLTSGPQSASYVASALTYMAQTKGDVQSTTFYPGCEGEGTDGSWGLFDDYGNGTVAWRRQGRAFMAVGQTLADTPVMLASAFDVEQDYTVLAGSDAEGTPGRISVVVSASASSYGAFNLTLSNAGFTPGMQASVTVYLIDASNEFDVVVGPNATLAVARDGSVSIGTTFSPPAVAWVLIDAPSAEQ